jgi:hypothetical protein
VSFHGNPILKTLHLDVLAKFRVRLPAGRTQRSTTLLDSNSRPLCSAIYVYLRRLDDTEASIEIGEREIEIKGKYLPVPVSKSVTACAFKGHDKAMQQQLDVFVDGVLVHSPSVDLAHQEDDISLCGQLDMSEYIGKTARLRMHVLNEKAKHAVPGDSNALVMIETGDKPRGEDPLYTESLRPQLRFCQMRG